MTDLLDLSRPEVQSALLPLALAFALAGAIRLLGGPGRGQAVAAIAVGLAFLAAYAVIVGLPPVPPRSGSQKVFHIVAIALALGAFLDLAPSLRNVAPAILVAGPIVAFLWLAWARLDGFAFNLESGSAVLRVVLGIAVLWRLASLLKDQATGAVLTLVYALGAGAIALIGHSASIAQLAFALAAATGGFLLWNWPTARWPFGFAGVLGGAGAAIALTFQLELFTKASAPALHLLALVAFADLAAKPFRPAGAGLAARAAGPIVIGLVAAVIAAAAAFIAFSQATD